jgi:ectoine hydroxylase-related dioxygenase (phytanoyl-CoA dioxygenase family)
VIADHWERTIRDPAHRAQLPRVHGLSPIATGQTADPSTGGTWSGIPQLQSQPFAEQTPTPVFATRGQALVFTYSMLHSGWVNEDSVARKAYIMTYMPAGVPGFLERNRIEGMRRYHARLREALEAQLPSRAHIVEKDFCHGVSEYGHNEGGDYWPEMFVPLPPPPPPPTGGGGGEAKL